MSAADEPVNDDSESESYIDWFIAEPRGVIPLHLKKFKLNISRSLRQILNKNIFEVKFDTRFLQVIKNCSQRKSTWINKCIIKKYYELHKLGFAHSAEVYLKGELAGGLYGVSLNGAFFGESMFHTHSNASKIAVVHLFNHLRERDFLLFDIQMITPVFEQFGAVEISLTRYNSLLQKAMQIHTEF
jgi:leucyl/phenylalanyl-tRNA---protein transferase